MAVCVLLFSHICIHNIKLVPSFVCSIGSGLGSFVALVCVVSVGRRAMYETIARAIT